MERSEMTLYGRSTKWAAALALGLAGLIGAGGAMVPAAPARTAASAFELTLEGTITFDDDEVIRTQGTFRSGAPFCATGTLVDPEPYGRVARFTCDDGTGSLTVSIGQVFIPPWNNTWRILDGSGSYEGLRGKGSMQLEPLEEGPRGATWRSTFQGVVDRDAVAPTITLSSASATKLRRPAGTYALRLGIGLRDDVADNPVSYTVRASGPGGRELARSFGTTSAEAVSVKLRIRPIGGARTVRLQITAEDPVGNEVSIWPRALRLPR
jgi:hypothetical protein